MLTIQQMQERLNRMTYKEGWTIKLYQGAFEGAHLQITAELDDSVELGKKTVFDVHDMMPPMLSIEQFDLYIIDRLMRIETHEAREWLKLDGKSLFYPHCDFADRDDIQYYQAYQNKNNLI